MNYDIDVPLFLPLYGAARLNDLRALARIERGSNGTVRFQGQVLNVCVSCCVLLNVCESLLHDLCQCEQLCKVILCHEGSCVSH